MCADKQLPVYHVQDTKCYRLNISLNISQGRKNAFVIMGDCMRLYEKYSIAPFLSRIGCINSIDSSSFSRYIRPNSPGQGLNRLPTIRLTNLLQKMYPHFIKHWHYISSPMNIEQRPTIRPSLFSFGRKFHPADYNSG